MASYRNITGRVSRSITGVVRQGRGPLSGLAAYVRNLAPGDRFIAGVLGVLVGIASFVSLVALERSFLIEVPVAGGSLTEGVVGAPRFVNPLLALSDTDRDLTALTYAGLMGYDRDGNLVPILAQSYTRSDDGLTYTFTLRDGAKFSDGSPVTADDIVFTVDKAKDPALKSPVGANWSNITALALDARTVRFTLPKAYAPFLEDATLGILPAHLWGGISSSEFPFSPYASEPVGAGPFAFGSVTRDSKGSITNYAVTANSNYVFGRPYLDRINVSVYGDAATLGNALRSGQVDSAYGIEQKGAIRVPYSRVFGVFFNPAGEPIFADASVRKALSLAIDRPALVKSVLGGYATPSIGPVPAGTMVPKLPLPDPATRIDDARKVLSDGGWKWNDANQSWTKGGKTLTVALKTSNVPELKALAAKVQSDWNSIGVPVTITLYSPGDLAQSVIRPRAYGALLFGEVVGSYPDLYAFWFSGERKDPGLNIADYASKDVDALLERARTEGDENAALADLAKANSLIANDYPAAFTHTPDFLYAVPSDLKGVSLTHVAEPSDRLRGARFWYRRTELVWPFLLKYK